MKKTTHQKIALLTVIAMMGAGPAALAYQHLGKEVLPQEQRNGSIAYITGGFGSEERAALEGVSNQYNLQIISSNKEGALVADTHITVFDTAHNIILDTVSGPLFYAELPAGKYVIAISHGEVVQRKDVIISGTNSHLHFTW